MAISVLFMSLIIDIVRSSHLDFRRRGYAMYCGITAITVSRLMLSQSVFRINVAIDVIRSMILAKISSHN